MDHEESIGTFDHIVERPTRDWIALRDVYLNGDAVARFDTSLTRDTSFGSGGLHDMDARGIAVDSAGSVIAAGYYYESPDDDQIVIRKLKPDGQFDNTFGTDGETVSSFPFEVRGNGAVIQSDGKIVALCNYGFRPCVSRFLVNGAVDTTFGDDGIRLLSEMGPRYSRAIALDDDGQILVLGMSSNAGQIARITNAGELDSTFGELGIAEFDISLPLSSQYDERFEAFGLAIQSDGKILIATNYEFDAEEDGNYETKSIVVSRFTGSGVLDLEFAGSGYLHVHLGPNDVPSQLLRRGGISVSDTRIFIGGELSPPEGNRSGAVIALWQ